MGRAALPADVAAAVSFFCSDRSDFISGQAINVSGAHEMHLRAMSDRFTAKTGQTIVVDGGIALALCGATA